MTDLLHNEDSSLTDAGRSLDREIEHYFIGLFQKYHKVKQHEIMAVAINAISMADCTRRCAKAEEAKKKNQEIIANIRDRREWFEKYQSNGKLETVKELKKITGLTFMGAKQVIESIIEEFE